MGEDHAASILAGPKPRNVLHRQVPHVGERRDVSQRAFTDKEVGAFGDLSQVRERAGVSGNAMTFPSLSMRRHSAVPSRMW